MPSSLLVTINQALALTTSERDVLQTMVDAGDRAGFYEAYYAMTGNTEAILQAKVASFSGMIGGAASCQGHDGTSALQLQLTKRPFRFRESFQSSESQGPVLAQAKNAIGLRPAAYRIGPDLRRGRTL